NGIGVVGWGVGGIEAEAAMLGQPINLLVPQVIGFKLHGKLPSGSTATDLVLTVTRMLRDKGVVGKFVEFYGDGVGALPLAHRAGGARHRGRSVCEGAGSLPRNGRAGSRVHRHAGARSLVRRADARRAPPPTRQGRAQGNEGELAKSPAGSRHRREGRSEGSR